MWNKLALAQMSRHASRSAGGSQTGMKKLDEFLGVDEGTADDEARREWAKSALEATRKRAEGWRNGATATLALVLASLALKPGEGLMKYQGDIRTVLMLLVGASVVCALLAAYRMTRAANGPGWLLELSPEAPADDWIRRIAGARLDLQVGQQLWIASIILFSGAVGVTWFQT